MVKRAEDRSSQDPIPAEMASPGISTEIVWSCLAEVMDPEVPALSVVDLGIVRDVRVTAQGTTVVITPTYSGCPAMHVIEQDIVDGLTERGISPVTVETVFVPAWTSDWISAAGRAKLVAYGIAAPGRASDEGELITLTRRPPAACPYCRSVRTVVRSDFGSTACKSINFCSDCQQPFEQFKAI